MIHTNDAVEWHEIELKSSLLRTVAQLSSKVFLGDEICRNPDWLRITVEYSVDSFMAAESLRIWPKMLRPVASKFLPRCRKVRAEMEEARQIITPVLEKRRAEKRAALKLGSTPKRYNDAMEWMEESAKGRQYDPAVGQMAFSVAAIHTTSDMMTQVIYDLCGKDDLIHGLREEIIAVLSQDGWKKTALYKLKLMDSMLKESQRLKPMSIGRSDIRI
jgi:cytochrome P450